MKTILLTVFIAVAVTTHAQYNRDRVPDEKRQEQFTGTYWPRQNLRILLSQTESPKALKLAHKANNWRITSNVTYGVAGAGAITSLILVANAETENQLGSALAVGLGSLATAGLGFVFSYFYS